MNEFIFEDSEIPDLVLETIIGFLVEMTPKERWGEIRSVSKRWNRISKPVIKETFERAWPKFILPKATIFALSKTRDQITQSGFPGGYVWSFVSPLPLRSIHGPVSVCFEIESGVGAYFGVFLVDKRESKLFENEKIWFPLNPKKDLRAGDDFCFCCVGGGSGTLIRHGIARGEYHEAHRASSGKQFTVTYSPGGTVVFTIGQVKHSTTQLEEADILAKFGETAILAFAVSMNCKKVVRVKRGPV